MERDWEASAYKAFVLCSIFLTLWFIWKARNAKIFDEKDRSPIEVLLNIKQQTFVILSLYPTPISNNPTTPTFSSYCSKWRLPRGLVIKFNTDAQFDLGSGLGYPVIICRNYKGESVAGCTSRIFASSMLVAEAIAMREAFVLAASLGIHSILVESDCKVLVDACRKETIRRDIDQILRDILGSKGILYLLRFSMDKS